MNYIGSKLTLLDFLYTSITSVVGNRKYMFSDLFAGTGQVGRFWKEKGHQVWANDLQYYSYVLNRHYIGTNSVGEFDGLREIVSNQDNQKMSMQERVFAYLNHCELKQGFIYDNYCLGGTQGQEFERQYFSDQNGKKCDTIRSQIEDWKNSNLVTEDEYFYLLASLMEAIDKVANTASVYGAFLKKLKKSAEKLLEFKPIRIYEGIQKNITTNSDVGTLVGGTKHDVIYLDPPYNHRQYSGNYHILETIAKYDSPEIHGKTGMRDCSGQKSDYCSRSNVKKAYSELIKNIDANYIFLSYNDEGLMSLEDIKEIMSTRGEYGVFEKEYQRFKADKTESRNHKKDSVIEYLHYVKITK